MIQLAVGTVDMIWPVSPTAGKTEFKFVMLKLKVSPGLTVKTVTRGTDADVLETGLLEVTEGTTTPELDAATTMKSTSTMDEVPSSLKTMTGTT